MGMRRCLWFVSAFLWVLASGLRADAAAVSADYKLGQRYQAAHQWGNAAHQYLQVLRDDPGATWVYKSLGTTYYMAGDKSGALSYYRRYLAAYPQDAQTRAFADRLAASLGAAAPGAQEGESPPSPAHPGGFSLRLESGAVSNSGADLTTLYTTPFSTPSIPSGVAPDGGIGVDYAMDKGFVAGFDLFDGPIRAYTVTVTGGFNEVDTWSINNLTIMLTPGWRFFPGSHWILEPRLGLGYMDTSGTVSFAVEGMSAQSETFSAAGLAFWPQLRAEYLFGNWGLGAGLGYLVADLSPVKNSSGTDVQTISASGTVSNWGLQNGGLTFSIFGAYHFQAPF
jgi:hypothetical protein